MAHKIPTIKARPAYQMNGNLYRTKPAAAKKAAWGMILAKYPEMDEGNRVLWYECECADHHPTGDYGRQEGWKFEICELHSRYDGYFRRLHKRLTRCILAKWEG